MTYIVVQSSKTKKEPKLNRNSKFLSKGRKGKGLSRPENFPHLKKDIDFISIFQKISKTDDGFGLLK